MRLKPVLSHAKAVISWGLPVATRQNLHKISVGGSQAQSSMAGTDQSSC